MYKSFFHNAIGVFYESTFIPRPPRRRRRTVPTRTCPACRARNAASRSAAATSLSAEIRGKHEVIRAWGKFFLCIFHSTQLIDIFIFSGLKFTHGHLCVKRDYKTTAENSNGTGKKA